MWQFSALIGANCLARAFDIDTDQFYRRPIGSIGNPAIDRGGLLGGGEEGQEKKGGQDFLKTHHVQGSLGQK